MATNLWMNLPDDVITEILLRLGLKTLIRLRCVCKSWNAMITNSTFITKHFNHNNNNNRYLLYLNSESYDKELVCYFKSEQTYVHRFQLKIPINYHFPVLVGTLNGLVCLSTESGRTICLWNPSIRKSKTFRYSSSAIPLSQLLLRKNYVVIGFGFYSRTNDYKIVRILYCKDVNWGSIANSPPPPVEVYSLSTNLWRRIEALVPCYGSHEQSEAFFNGCVHWVAYKSVAYPDHDHTIMSFDIAGEVFGEMTLPDYNIDGVPWVDLNLAVLKESLSLCACFKQSGHCDIWVMSKYGVVESWTKQFTIVLPQARIERFFGFTKNNVVFLEMENVVFLEMGGGKLVSYDLGILQLTNLGIQVARDSGSIFPFMESLVLL